ncbi:LexA/Signal peptidase [Bimuria novae-zelandiae CBS 107.79]|uniref:Mitochondrial inner membrane protease subunit n=1 Tax=Bimuria novae-zelandiae CBS 107.79 TaxID=1447943 RepID=A0A6A5ULH4_9PLEO|nr:LexA/Signal peptidase [Bimuria novae-zelandiae CBS 107.79]
MPPPRIWPPVTGFFSQRPPRHTTLRDRLHTHNVASLLCRMRIHHSSAPLSRAPKSALWYLKTTAKVFLTLHIFMTYIGTIGPTEGISMVPTIPHSYRGHPYVLESRLHRRGRNIDVGDVVAFTIPGKQNAVGCKRVIGMPGDFVSVMSGQRGEADLKKMDDEGDWANVKEQVIRVPEGHCWVVGDNLEWSRDSRVFGPLPLNLVRGKVLAVVWPPSAWKTLGGDEGLRDQVEGGHDFVVAR